jgi:Cys-Gly metallodipeptidase DUG1
MSKWLESQLKALGATDIQLKDLGIQEGTKDLKLPPVVLARYGTDPRKKTILLYGHYDVQPALKEDSWNTDPFTLTEVGDCLYGRGSTDDKGPVIAWLNLLQAHNEGWRRVVRLVSTI